jgi:radical SAM-linked protein
VFEDHRGVVGTAGPDADRQQSLAELLDREILPCLERPGRLLGPFDLPSATVTGSTKLALVWPSIAEGAHVPEALRPLIVELPNPRPFSLSLGSVPSPNLDAALRARGLPLFGRPDWTSLAAMDLWIVWIDHPLQLTGLLTILDSCGLPLHATERGAAPRIVAAGPALAQVQELARVYADAVWLGLDGLDGAAWEALAEAASAGDDWIVRLTDVALALEPVTAAPAPARAGAPEPSAPAQARRDQRFAADLTVRGGFADRASWRERGRADAYTDHVVVGAGSAPLREATGGRPAEELVAEIARSLGQETASLALHFVYGLEGETETDRLAIADFVNFAVDAAPRGARQVRVILHELSGAEPSTGFGPVEAGRAGRILERVKARRVRIDAPVPCLSAIETVLGGGPEASTVLERVWADGAREGEAAASSDPGFWRRALGLPEPGSEPGRAVEAAPTGLPANLVVEAPASVSPVATRDRSARADRRRPGRWVRWRALVPQHFDYRIEYAKTGRLRFLGPTELSDLLLGACERARVPVCTSGVVQPRPRVGFGPSLPAGIAGDREYIDFSLERKIDDLGARLRSELPEEIRLIAVEFMPRCGPSLQLSRIAFAEYEAELLPGIHRSAADREADAARVRRWESRIGEGLPPVGDDSADPLSQLRRIHWTPLPDDAARLEFTLDLRTESTRCKPREVVERALGGVAVDPRLIPLRRRRLLVEDDGSPRARLRTPMEMVRMASRRLRSLERMRAE